MKIQTVILGLVIAIGIIYFIWTKFISQKVEPFSDLSRPSNECLPKQEVQNDKLVVVNNITSSEIERILIGFCNIYNKENYQAQPRLYKTDNTSFTITFPYDIEFEIFCYFVNYVRYPMGFNKSFEVTGWTTTKSGQTWITEKSANKRVMLFIPTEDTEYDNVYMTTEDNIGYKLGFAIGEEKQLLKRPLKKFVKSGIDILDLKEKEYKDYK